MGMSAEWWPETLHILQHFHLEVLKWMESLDILLL